MRERANRRGRQYAAIPNAAMRDSDMSIEARGLLALLMTYSDEWVFRRDHLMAVSGMKKDKFTRVMSELVEAGYVERIVDQDEAGRMLGRTWLIRDDRAEPSASVVRENQTTDTEVRENRSPAQPMSGKSAPIRKPTDKNTNNKNPQPPEGATDLFSENETGETEEPEVDPIDQGFDEFWQAYPKKAAKPAARKAWAKAVKRASADVIIAGAKAYAKWLAEPLKPGEFKPHPKHPQGWLNDDRWAEFVSGNDGPRIREEHELTPATLSMLGRGVCPPSMQNEDKSPNEEGRHWLAQYGFRGAAE